MNEATPIRLNDARRILAGEQSPTLDELSEMAQLAGMKVQVVVTVPGKGSEVAA